jgi:hypothetical protein
MMLFPEELDRKTKYIFIKITFLKPTVLALIIEFLLEIVFGMLSTLFTFFFSFYRYNSIINQLKYITFLFYNTKISDNNPESGKVLAAFPR